MDLVTLSAVEAEQTERYCSREVFHSLASKDEELEHKDLATFGLVRESFGRFQAFEDLEGHGLAIVDGV